MKYIIAFAVILLSGCQTSSDYDYCASLAKPGTEDFRHCLIWKGQESVERRQHERAKEGY